MTNSTTVATSAEIRHERMVHVLGLTTFNISYALIEWPQVREAINEQDWLRLTGIAMTAGARIIIGIADIRRAPQKIKKDATRHVGGSVIINRFRTREDVLLPAIGVVLAAVGGATRLWYARRNTQSSPGES